VRVRCRRVLAKVQLWRPAIGRISRSAALLDMHRHRTCPLRSTSSMIGNDRCLRLFAKLELSRSHCNRKHRAGGCNRNAILSVRSGKGWERRLKHVIWDEVGWRHHRINGCGWLCIRSGVMQTCVLLVGRTLRQRKLRPADSRSGSTIGPSPPDRDRSQWPVLTLRLGSLSRYHLPGIGCRHLREISSRSLTRLMP
jgi:hypothetical protein